jgi:hypothetical protein
MLVRSRIVREVGRGGMGVVHEAEQLSPKGRGRECQGIGTGPARAPAGLGYRGDPEQRTEKS